MWFSCMCFVGHRFDSPAFDSVWLPPANVWGKVIFAQACVCHSVHWGGGLYDVTSCLAAWSHVPSRGSLCLVPCSFYGGLYPGGLYYVTSCLAAWFHAPSVGVSVSGPMFLLGKSLSAGLYPGGSLSGWTSPHPRRAGGMHPTGMLSYYRLQRSWGKVIFSEACVKNFVCRGCLGTGPGEALGVWPGGSPGPHLGEVGGSPQARGCPGSGGIPACTEADTPPSRRLLLRAVHILLECFLVFQFGFGRTKQRW